MSLPLLLALQVVSAAACGLDLPAVEVAAPIAAKQEAQDYAAAMEKLLPVACELGRLGAVDQYSRRVLTGHFGNLGEGSAAFEAYTEAVAPHLEAVDAVTTARLKALLETVTWRELTTDVRFLFQPAFHIVQHSNDDPFMQATLFEITPLAKEGLIDGVNVAKMHDRLRLAAGLGQTYGTHISCIDGERVAHDLDEPETVDERRAEMGMNTLDEHVAELNAYFEPCADMD